ncbi:MAG: DUF1194 domain-containing protein [Pseudomonadota bacterium]|nr:DUF1194 domain-containing protein [Pseudomonadota bacterium]
MILAAAAAMLAAPASSAEPVDVELVLAVDISLSMSPGELETQRQGYARALTDPQVLNAITKGPYGRIAVTYFEWAGNTAQYVVVPWTVIANRADAERVAEQLSAPKPRQSRRTSISGALNFAADLLAESNFRALRRVIDISGDGPNNEGVAVDAARDAVVAQKIVINGLPVMAKSANLMPYDVADLDRYYSECVIGGPGSFVIPVVSWAQFPEALRRKLLLELAGRSPPRHDASEPILVLARTEPAYDCAIGEKLWRQDRHRQRIYDP